MTRSWTITMVHKPLGWKGGSGKTNSIRVKVFSEGERREDKKNREERKKHRRVKNYTWKKFHLRGFKGEQKIQNKTGEAITRGGEGGTA